MSGWLLDTNILSELRKAKASRPVRTWVRERHSHELYVSRITFAEIRYGINLLDDSKRKKDLLNWLDRELHSWFGERVLEIDEAVIVKWRELVEKGRKQGITYSQPDLFIAATAVVHDLTLVTRSVSDFVGIKVSILNPWETKQ